MPWALLMTALFTPTTSPRMLNSGPPLLPGLISASVWMKSSSGPTPSTRSFAEMSPCETLRSSPKGLPMATTQSPDLEAVGVAEHHRRQVGPVEDPEQGQVGVRIAPHQLGVEDPPVRETDLDPLGVLHHVVVAHHVALGTEQESRTGRGGHAAGGDALHRPGVGQDVEHPRADRADERRERARGGEAHQEGARAVALSPEGRLGGEGAVSLLEGTGTLAGPVLERVLGTGGGERQGEEGGERHESSVDSTPSPAPRTGRPSPGPGE